MNCTQWRINILNASSQSSEDFMEIYIWKNIITYGHPNYIETFMVSIRMTQIFMEFYQIITLSFTWLCIIL